MKTRYFKNYHALLVCMLVIFTVAVCLCASCGTDSQESQIENSEINITKNKETKIPEVLSADKVMNADKDTIKMPKAWDSSVVFETITFNTEENSLRAAVVKKENIFVQAIETKNAILFKEDKKRNVINKKHSSSVHLIPDYKNNVFGLYKKESIEKCYVDILSADLQVLDSVHLNRCPMGPDSIQINGSYMAVIVGSEFNFYDIEKEKWILHLQQQNVSKWFAETKDDGGILVLWAHSEKEGKLHLAYQWFSDGRFAILAKTAAAFPIVFNSDREQSDIVCFDLINNTASDCSKLSHRKHGKRDEIHDTQFFVSGNKGVLVNIKTGHLRVIDEQSGVVVCDVKPDLNVWKKKRIRILGVVDNGLTATLLIQAKASSSKYPLYSMSCDLNELKVYPLDVPQSNYAMVASHLPACILSSNGMICLR